jgi:hypothetical protein
MSTPLEVIFMKNLKNIPVVQTKRQANSQTPPVGWVETTLIAGDAVGVRNIAIAINVLRGAEDSYSWAIGPPVKNEKSRRAGVLARHSPRLMVRRTHPTTDFSKAVAHEPVAHP